MIHTEAVCSLCWVSGIVRIVKCRALRWARETRNSHRTQFGEHTFGVQCISMVEESDED
jgi:hypothetical protein